MRLLQTPPTDNKLTTSISLQGVTKLKDGFYNLRHTGSKNALILPDGTISDYVKPVPKAHSKRPRLLVPEAPASNTPVPDPESGTLPNDTKPPKYYRLKKSLIRQRILTFISAQRGKKLMHFVTVTYPPVVNDKQAYKYLNQWLTVLRSKGWIKDYLWIAERQTNGTIHYHIAIPHYFNISRANKTMQTILCSEVRKGALPWSIYAAKRYNGCDLAKNRKTKRVTNFAVKKGSKSLVSYLTKYITKNDTKFSTYCWHCSRSFSNLILKICVTNTEYDISGYEQLVDKSRAVDTDYFTFIPWSNDPPPEFVLYLNVSNHCLSTYLNRPAYLN